MAIWRPGMVLFVVASVALAQPAIRPADLPYWPGPERESYAAYERALNAIPDRDHLLRWHELLASEPHIAGTPGDARTIERLVQAFTEMGFEVERHEFYPYLAYPVSCAVEIIEPDHLSLAVKETPLAEDPFSGHPDQMVGWNAYSGTGDVTAGVVYANYGTKADFERLQSLGVDVTGKIVIARYGGNYRGFKARFAEAAGAAGVIIYTDPADGGYGKGITYPEGGYANSTCIERGSIATMGYSGDPLTPFVEATKDAARLDLATVDLPRIPVQPVGWGAAGEILSRMRGEAVPAGWQGGLPTAYRLTGGDALRVRVQVEQKRSIVPTSNVIATLRGEIEPERKVIIGCHHDAWDCGAADPLAGMISLLESARSFSELAAKGQRPARSIVFCAWGAEEFGIIGSVEWVEKMRDDLFENAVAYINLDMASMGPDFGASTAPSLRRLVTEAARAVPQARDAARSVAEAWISRAQDPVFSGSARFGDLGGGSDHIGFWCHVAVGSTSLGGGGSKGTSYHSTFDTLPWYWKVVGSDYEPALMVGRMTSAVAGRLANAPLIPLDPVRYGLETRRLLVEHTRRAVELGMFERSDREVSVHFGRLEGACIEYDRRAADIGARLLVRMEAGDLPDEKLAEINSLLMGLDRAWFDNDGLPGRPWFRNLYAASDEDSGYAPSMLPAIRSAIERKDHDALRAAVERYLEVLRRLQGIVDAVDAALR